MATFAETNVTRQNRRKLLKLFKDLKELEDEIRSYNGLVAEDLERIRLETQRPGTAIHGLLYRGDE